MNIDKWLQLHWDKILIAALIIFFIIAAIGSKDYDYIDLYDSDLQEHLR